MISFVSIHFDYKVVTFKKSMKYARMQETALYQLEIKSVKEIMLMIPAH